MTLTFNTLKILRNINIVYHYYNSYKENILQCDGKVEYCTLSVSMTTKPKFYIIHGLKLSGSH